VIPEGVEKKIRFMCKELPTVEWSGVLFYTYEGTFENKDLTIICKDFFVMDIGNATYTEFINSPDVAAYMCENPELIDCQMALIHSHNQMSCFFSGTDLSTLLDEGKDRNNFVSLIVNNEGTYTAAITRKIEYNEAKYEFFGEGTKTVGSSNTVIEYFMLDINKEAVEPEFKELKERLEEIKKFKTASIKYEVNPSFKEAIRENENSQLSLWDLDDVPKTINSGMGIVNLKVDAKIVHSIVVQLLTACPIIDVDKINLKNWIGNMPVKYSRRFRSKNDFEYFAECYAEYLVLNAYDYRLTAYNEDIVLSAYAEAIIKELRSYGSNEFIDTYIKIIERYIV
jgi:proteasome lid subunit RPN8/RPN11